ncbi:hypothetical protein Francci3_3892 [Frankia casuarinae]|uniref:Uncharacterized protein n=1 Tax=Frankia casuarinae (strain DSM 45818 / CECT 9043 / HFP020203 / CcI3) TaxID=106370 RepID=Q2J650_FRACC|nr:hypothetical protein Francci3_3892 [Frankia casuarinae]
MRRLWEGSEKVSAGESCGEEGPTGPQPEVHALFPSCGECRRARAEHLRRSARGARMRDGLPSLTLQPPVTRCPHIPDVWAPGFGPGRSRRRAPGGRRGRRARSDPRLVQPACPRWADGPAVALARPDPGCRVRQRRRQRAALGRGVPPRLRPDDWSGRRTRRRAPRKPARPDPLRRRPGHRPGPPHRRLRHPRVAAWSGTTIGPQDPIDGIWLRATATDPAVCRINASRGAVEADLCVPLIPNLSPALVAGSSLAYLAKRRLDGPDPVYEIGAHGHGADGQALAERLCDHIRTWDTDRKAGPTLTAISLTADAEVPPTAIVKKDCAIIITFWQPRVPRGRTCPSAGNRGQSRAIAGNRGRPVLSRWERSAPGPRSGRRSWSSARHRR